MKQNLALVSLLVRDYDEAIDFYVGVLGFELLEDTAQGVSPDSGKAKRWVVVSPKGSSGSALLLAEADGDEQAEKIGNQTGGRVSFFLHTDDFWRDYERFKAGGVEFVRGEPRVESYGTVAVFVDGSGNLWDLIEPKTKS